MSYVMLNGIVTRQEGGTYKAVVETSIGRFVGYGFTYADALGSAQRREQDSKTCAHAFHARRDTRDKKCMGCGLIIKDSTSL